MKNKKYVLGAIALMAVFVLMGDTVTVTGIGRSTSTVTNTYDANTSDTVKWARENGVVGLAFGISVTDSVQIKNVIVKRVVDGRIVTIPAVAVADTIAGAAVSGTVPAGADSAADAASFVHAITMTPYADEYWVIVKYDADGAHTYKNAVDTNTVKYEFIKQFSK